MSPFLVLASILSVTQNLGYPLLGVFVGVEALGIPVPGETAVILAGLAANDGRLSIVLVIIVAAAGAIIGDNAGYWLGRKGGRALLRRIPLLHNYFERILPPAERFFKKHGAKTVFFGRFISLLRVTAAWLAGISHMPWWRFLFWNAAGGIIWATAFGVVAYYSGQAAAEAINKYGLYAGAGLAVLIVGAIVGIHFWRKRMFGET
jgi:membrane protein DedA with SNARE-associated domain